MDKNENIDGEASTKISAFSALQKKVSLMKSNLKTADLLVYLSYFALLTCERKLTTYAACYCISHAPVGSKCKKKYQYLLLSR